MARITKVQYEQALSLRLTTNLSDSQIVSRLQLPCDAQYLRTMFNHARSRGDARAIAAKRIHRNVRSAGQDQQYARFRAHIARLRRLRNAPVTTEAQDRAMIEAALAEGRVTKLPPALDCGVRPLRNFEH